MIRDLEEQLLRIPRLEAREHMAEAVRCYHAGAHRAAIVMAFAAGMDDLRRKLVELASTGGASPALRDATRNIEATFAAQRAYEEEAILAAEKHAQLISPDESKALQSYLKLRHLCAHPSGYVAAAEEARAVMARVVDSVLSRPATLGMVFVHDLLLRLRSEHFFPAKRVEDVATTMEHELALLAPALFPALIAKLVETVRAESAGASPAAIWTMLRSALHRNALAALIGMAVLPQTRSLFWSQRSVQELILSPEAPLDALKLLAARPAALAALDDITRGRLLFVAQRNLQNAIVRVLLRRIDEFLRPKEREDFVQALRKEFVESLSAQSPCALAEVGWVQLEDEMFARILAEAAGHTYGQVNNAVEAADALSASQVGRISTDIRAQFLLRIAAKSEGEYPSFRARDRRTTGLGPRTDFIDALVDEVQANPLLLKAEEGTLHALFEMLIASKRPDAVGAFIRAMTASSVSLPNKARDAARKAVSEEVGAALEGALSQHPT